MRQSMEFDKTPVNPYVLAGVIQASQCGPVPRERRASPRHQVDAKAYLLLVKSGSALRGKILNLSPIGCRIHCDEKIKIGIYTRVETEFYLEGMSFLLAGAIQAKHSAHDVGIRFLDVSPRKQEQIHQLIRDLEELQSTPRPATDALVERRS